MVTYSPRTTPPLREGDPLAEIVRDMGELFRQHSASLGAKIRKLEERVQDLEGHAEHGPAGTCGVCAPDDGEPETVGADVYGLIKTADFEGQCHNPHCTDRITPGDDVIEIDEGMYVHEYCH